MRQKVCWQWNGRIEKRFDGKGGDAVDSIMKKESGGLNKLPAHWRECNRMVSQEF